MSVVKKGGEAMDERLEVVFFRWMSVVLLGFVAVSVGFTVVVKCNVQRMVLLIFAAGMYVAMLVVLSMIKSLIDHRIKAEENDKARQSDERKNKMEIDRSEREAERIRAAERMIVVIRDKNDN